MNASARALRLWYTVRHLRPVQIYGRAWHRLHRPRIDLSPAPPAMPARGQWQGCARAPSMLGPNRFRFLNAEHDLRNGDWNDRALPKLWLYNLHYFDDLVADGAAARAGWHADLVRGWIASNPPGAGNGWEPYCLSLRTVNWIKWLLSGHAPADDAARQAALDSLAVQARYLAGRLERHLLGNHLWANYKALLFAGLFFDGEEGARWLDIGLRGMRREIGEQILADGGHFERSPMYHAILLEDLLDLIQLGERYAPAVSREDLELWRTRAASMLGWLAVMTHPDGGIAFFNDAAHGIAPELAPLQDYARSLGLTPPERSGEALQLLPESGYARLEYGEAVLIADIGEVGPNYLPGHAHADTLSFELSLRGRRVLVNAGTSRYDIGAERLWQRGTAAHNTVQIDDQDSSEVWSSFRVARRALPFAIGHGQDSGGVWLEAAHDGYKRLPGRAVHCRRWRLQEDQLRVEDRIEGRFARAVARYRTPPGLRIGAARVAGDGIEALRWRSEPEGLSTHVAASTYHAGFGRSEACDVLEVAVPRDTGSAAIVFTWTS
ncbi:alginate lyase family protein [Lysobacter firmicutimachus]|uniref:Alginate lyase family protein n=1 Tax=Lysobacter firmicutimachus TaxID=1792846 RepID=A0ABU8CYM1_9GAMM